MVVKREISPDGTTMTVTLKGGTTITMFWSKTLNTWVTVPGR